MTIVTEKWLWKSKSDFPGEKWGFIDNVGKIAIQYAFDWAKAFSEGLAEIKMNGRHGFISRTGMVVIPCSFDEAHKFSEGLAKVKINGKYGFINKNGVVVIQCFFDNADSFLWRTCRGRN